MRKTQKIAFVGGTVGVLMAGGVAFAAWTSSGSDTGNVTAGHQVNLSVDAGDVSGLYPTLGVDVPVKVTNNNPYPVTLSTIHYTDAGSSTSAAGCALSNVVVDDPDPAGEILAAHTQGAVHMAHVTMIAGADTSCQDAVFTLNFTATAAN
jgi:hypothetical protein